jgi:hypothetical protein
VYLVACNFSDVLAALVKETTTWIEEITQNKC